MDIFGVINTSPDSLNTDSIASTTTQVHARAASLIEDGADAFDLGGQGSTDVATEVSEQIEWSRIAEPLEVLVSLGRSVSVDTFHPGVARRAFQLGATHLNAADGMQHDAMWEVAAEFDVGVVVPFMIGDHPHRLRHTNGDPFDEMLSFFEARLATAERFGMRPRCLLDPGTGFAPRNWLWDQRYVYQKHVYTHLDRLRVFDLPLYIPLPWKQTPQHRELLGIVLAHRPEYGRAHYPAVIREAIREGGWD